ncbi:hypothetical protein RvY_15281 [Ramazzottius varieornatus]|uniref:Reverse transcriptase domain-containing protein n=1 Tax=Ramazzottius varieornatus TaxID=947166 RepID=A0A1D1VUC1_RAMVA|nr:hypothetical protein RvY_15281 [Ramazzottius varieornatus]
MAHQYTQPLLRREEKDAVFLDCSKAVDKISHSIIIVRLSSHGVKSELKVLLSDYLRGRGQRVVINGHFPVSVACRLVFLKAQISVQSCSSSPSTTWQRDSVLWRYIKGEEDCRLLQQDLNGLKVWCEATGLELNPEKSQHFRVSNKIKKVEGPGGSYMIGGKKISLVSEAECSGVKFSSKADWTAQVDKVTARCRRRFHAINSLFPTRYGAAKQLLCTILVRSVVDHASSSWFFSAKTYRSSWSRSKRNSSEAFVLARSTKKIPATTRTCGDTNSTFEKSAGNHCGIGGTSTSW